MSEAADRQILLFGILFACPEFISGFQDKKNSIVRGDGWVSLFVPTNQLNRISKSKIL
jgi:hypothetical protein